MNREYDGSRAGEIDELIKFAFNAYKQHPQNADDLVYKILCCKNLKPSELESYQGKTYLCGKSNEYMFEHWKEKFQNRPNIFTVRDMENHPYFFQFVSKRDVPYGKYIKLYIPLDLEHLEEGATRIFNFLDQSNIKHASKISKAVRVDNVIIRLRNTDYESANRIINFINNDPYLKEGLNKVNPLIPTIGGIGYMQEHGNSYNSDISTYITYFFEDCLKRDIEPSGDLFRRYLSECEKHNIPINGQQRFDTSILDVFEEAYTGKKTNRLNPLINNMQKNALIMDALKTTYFKYGLAQVKAALREIIGRCNYGYISNGNANIKYREELKDKVAPRDFEHFIEEFLMMSKIENIDEMSINQQIDVFCNISFSDQLPYILDEICGVTLENHGQEQVESAINNFIYSGSSRFFSRFSKNDKTVNQRDKLKFFNRLTMNGIIRKALLLKGIDISNIPDEALAGTYSMALAQSKYSAIDDSDKIGLNV